MEALHPRSCRTFVLDGDNVRRIGEMAKIFMEAGVIVLTAFISPSRTDRERVRAIVEQGDFIEIYCDTPIEFCELRDVKGLYKKARSGQLAEFTGVTSPYEEPENSELTVQTRIAELDVCVRQVVDKMMQFDIIDAANFSPK